MDIIRNYLETMFAGLPDTPEVRRAKAELGEMMEDKYTELLEGGMSENEAIGTVISEFGNLEELSPILGIEEYVRTGNISGNSSVENDRWEEDFYREEYVEEENSDCHFISADEARDYLSAARLSGVYTTTGVVLCIISPILLFFGSGRGLYEAFAGTAMFVFVAGAVALFIISGSVMRPWKYVKKSSCCLDPEARYFVESEAEAAASGTTLLRTTGIALCVLSVAPVIVFDVFGGFLEEFGVAAMFVIVAAGVAMILLSGFRMGAYKKLLKLDYSKSAGRGAEYSGRRSSDGRSYRHRSSGKSKEYRSGWAARLMPVYWETVTAIYLCYSFLTFNWHSSWMIWIFAGIVKKILDNSLRSGVQADE